LAAIGLIGLAGSTASAQTSAPAKLRLVCEGTQQTAEPVDYHPRLAHEGGPAAGSGVGLQTHMTSNRDKMQIEVSGAGGRLRLPATLAAAHHARTESGWLPLTDVMMSEEEITGRFKLSAFTTAHLRIDRTTGEVVSHGGGDFTGVCDKAPDTPPQRKF
jgi:hypothetical protein